MKFCPADILDGLDIVELPELDTDQDVPDTDDEDNDEDE